MAVIGKTSAGYSRVPASEEEEVPLEATGQQQPQQQQMRAVATTAPASQAVQSAAPATRPPVVAERVVEVHHHYYHAAPTAGAAELAPTQQQRPADVDITLYAQVAANTAKDYLSAMWDRSRPWGELLDLRRLSLLLPTEIAHRVQSNWETFKANYGLVATGLSAAALLQNPFGLLLFGGASLWVSKKIAAIHQIDPTFERYRGKVIGWSLLGLLAFILTGVGPAIIGAVSTSAFLCCMHAIFSRPAAVVEEAAVDPFGTAPRAADVL